MPDVPRCWWCGKPSRVHMGRWPMYDEPRAFACDGDWERVEVGWLRHPEALRLACHLEDDPT